MIDVLVAEHMHLIRGALVSARIASNAGWR